MTPLQSVIIPTFNRRDMLAETIASVLRQSQTSLEVIVVDDCSTDGTEEYVMGIEDERVRYFRNEKNSGSERSREYGLKQARGRYITFIDDDDYYTDDEFFAKALKVFADNEGLAIVCADGEIIDTEAGTATPHYPGEPGLVNGTEYVLKQEREYIKPTSLFPAVFDGGIMRSCWPDDMRMFDTETYLWMALYGNVYVMPDIVGVYRLHPNSNTKGRARSSEWMTKRMKNLASRVEIDREIWRRLCVRANRRAASRWYMKMMELQIRFFKDNARGMHDGFEIYRTVMRESRYMPELLLMMPYFVLKFEVRQIKFLFNLYMSLKRYRSKLAR